MSVKLGRLILHNSTLVCCCNCLVSFFFTAGFFLFPPRIYYEKMGLGPPYIPINFETDLNHCLDTKNLDFAIYLLLRALAEDCTL